MPAYDVRPSSPWGIEKKRMAMALGLLLGLSGIPRAQTYNFTTVDGSLPPPPNNGDSRVYCPKESWSTVEGAISLWLLWDVLWYFLYPVLLFLITLIISLYYFR